MKGSRIVIALLFSGCPSPAMGLSHRAASARLAWRIRQGLRLPSQEGIPARQRRSELPSLLRPPIGCRSILIAR